jgi:hypothetical protein
VTRLVLLGLASCVGFGPEVGPVQHVSCADVDSDPDSETTFETHVRPLLEGAGHCPDCHTPAGPTPSGLEVTGFDLSSLATLMAGGTQSGIAIVVPGHPCDSVLIQKLGEVPPFGVRMPLDGPPFLGADEIQVIADWIVEGAP